MKSKRRFLIGLLLALAAFLALVLFIISIIFHYWLGPDSVESSALPQVDKTISFSVAVLPDTQFYSAKYPDIFCQQTNWLVANQERLNIVFVSQLGDLVNDGGRLAGEWQVASSCLGKLDGKIPYNVVPGNHDAEMADAPVWSYQTYNATFPPERFKKYSWYQGNYRGNQNNYEVITENNQPFLFLNLEFDPAKEVIAWAQSVLSKYSQAHTILITHRYLLDNGQGRDSTGQRLWQQLVYKNCSIKMVWSGHYHEAGGENRLASLNSCHESVEQIVQDYQAREKGGAGFLRIYVFTPSQGKINVYTYSPMVGALEVDEDSRFTINW
jgi:hypothetical protein